METPDDQCPVRGAGLTHIAIPTRMGMFCQECHQPLLFKSPHFPPKPPPDRPQPAPDWDANKWLKEGLGIDVNQRMRDLGLLHDDELPLLPDHENFIEGRWITGNGPDGDRLGRGRADHRYGQHNVRLKRLRESYERGDRD